jgi:hypothetical protein
LAFDAFAPWGPGALVLGVPYFWVNGHVQRCISAIAPSGMPPKSAGSHPLVE